MATHFKLGKTLVRIAVDWRRWTIGVSWNRFLDDWQIYLPVVQITIWLPRCR